MNSKQKNEKKNVKGPVWCGREMYLEFRKCLFWNSGIWMYVMKGT